MSEPRWKRERRARGRHRARYWVLFDREDYTCPDCGRGVDEVDHFEVHHRDGNPLNGDWENLIGLCFRCHLSRHGKRKHPDLEEWKQGFLELGQGEPVLDKPTFDGEAPDGVDWEVAIGR